MEITIVDYFGEEKTFNNLDGALIKFLAFQNPSMLRKINEQLFKYGLIATGYGESIKVVDLPVSTAENKQELVVVLKI